MPAPVHRVDTELNDLSLTYGQPVIVNETLRIKTMFGALDERPARVAEVVPVIQRPNGRLVTMTKTNYPLDAFRLPSGGIHKGEAILDALLRESYEETGLTVVVRRFLAIIRYQVIIAGGRTGRFTSFAFLVEGDGPLQPQDPNERIAGFREVAVTDLRPMAAFLQNLKTNDDNDWNDWGRYRSVVHRVVADVLDPAGNGQEPPAS
jgi:8-oxo-dGTP pyrophosphatase MutT (NUDIX family)